MIVRDATATDIAFWAKRPEGAAVLATQFVRHCYFKAVARGPAISLCPDEDAAAPVATLGAIVEWDEALRKPMAEIWSLMAGPDILRAHARPIVRVLKAKAQEMGALGYGLKALIATDAEYARAARFARAFGLEWGGRDVAFAVSSRVFEKLEG